jgi:hypothetical protein
VHFAFVEPGAFDARADGIRGFADQQRFVTGNEVGAGGVTGEMGAQAVEGELQGGDYLPVAGVEATR